MAALWGGTQLVTAHCPTGSKESLFSCTLTASEEAMAVLEETVMYVFQQCVYYISKVGSALTRSCWIWVTGVVVGWVPVSLASEVCVGIPQNRCPA